MRSPTVTIAERRRALVARHHLAGDAESPEAVVADLIALHATDPASVYLSTLARSATTTLEDIAAAMYGRRTLVRWLAMRRTLFVFARPDIPAIQSAASAEVGRILRRRLISRLARNGTEPPLPDDLDSWLGDLENRVARALDVCGAATGAQLAATEPGLQTRVLARTASERPQKLTTELLTILGAQGRIVRATPTGAWTHRQHRWEPVAQWWPEGLPAVDPDAARAQLARRWLERFGPARIEDLRWWTGWNATTTARSLAGLPTAAVDLHGGPGIDLIDADADRDDLTSAAREPVAALLPALDPTPMGWTDRRWFLGIDPALIFDRAGNIGPTVWWDGEIIGAWAVSAAGELRWELVADRGAQARDAVEAAAARLQPRLGGTVVTPAIRTPLERSLVS